MHKTQRIIQIIVWIVITSVLLSGCNLFNLLYPAATPTIAPTATQEPPKELTICLGYEPRSLYAYKATAAAEQEALQAITDGPIDVDARGTKIAILLEQLPNFEDGSVSFSPVTLRAGDAVVNTAGNLVVFETGTTVFPSGCTNGNCAVTWDGTSELQVDQLTVTFVLKSDLRWSDGEALTAGDSVFAFEIAADPITPTDKYNVDVTQRYTALDEMTIEWVGMPGLVTDAFAEFIWGPMPSHAWGSLSAEELLSDEQVNRYPLSYGPFMVEEWKIGESIQMVKNPYYHRMDEGLPAADRLTFRFLSADDPASLLTAASAACDVVSSSALDMQDINYLNEHAGENGMELRTLQPDTLEMLAFGITPVSYDDYYYPYGADRPDIFGDVRTRQAFAYCIDEATLGNKLLGASVEMATSLLPTANPLSGALSISTYSYDPTRATELLSQVGWMDYDQNPDTPITAVNVYDVPPGTPFSVELLITDSQLRSEVAGEIAANLAMCGIDVNITVLPMDTFYEPGPDGKLFGRQFDLALFSLQTDGNFDCSFFKTGEIPTEANYWLGETTGGANFVGFKNDAYDQLCTASENTGLDHASADQDYLAALQILNSELPIIPIYYYPEAYLINETMCGSAFDHLTMLDVMRDIEKLSVGPICPQ